MRQRLLARSRWWAVALVVGCCGLSCSRSGSLNPVKGKVLLNNEPLPGAMLTFHPKGNDDFKAVRPTAQTKEDGTFVVMTGDREGAPAGEYVVTIICSQTPDTKGKMPLSTTGVETRDRLGGALATREKSTIVVQVKSGPNQLDTFSLK